MGPVDHEREASMKKVFLAILCLAISCTTAQAGEIYGTVKEGGKPIKAGTKVEVKCAKGSYSAETDKLGSYRLFAPEQGKCTLSVKTSDGSPQMTVTSFEDSSRYNLVLEKKDGKSSLRSE
jgi:beta-lactam-binding protein with PASTA domain